MGRGLARPRENKTNFMRKVCCSGCDDADGDDDFI